MLYPKMTKSRMVLSLDGLWDFKLLNQDEVWDAAKPLCGGLAMPVPCSYNDIYPGRDFKNHMGSMVYERYVDIPEMLLRERLLLRFGSVTHKAVVYLNGVEAVSHKGGFLPFEVEIQGICHAGENRITVVVDNIVDDTTLPCGRLATERFPGLKERRVNLVNFDFFNYSGIMRPVVLYTTPKEYIRDITVNGKADGSFTYEIDVVGEGEVRVELLESRNCCCGAESRAAGSADSENTACCCGTKDAVLWQSTERKGTGEVENCHLWSVEEPNLYRLRVTLKGADGTDEYTEEFGFREFYVRDGKLWLNGEEIYLKGFGKHEDAVVNGRGFNEAYNVKDIALMKWMGANSFRTSHYPYSEEMMRLCDREGILVIDEVPAVGLHTGFTATGLLGGTPNGTWKTLRTVEHHADVIRDLIARDKNHPCVVTFSIANEPASEEDGAAEYFAPLFDLVRENDPAGRPVTVVTYGGATPETCKVAHLCDFLMINRYNGWYDTEGNMEGAAAILGDELTRYHEKFPEKPIVFGEFGADAVAGLHDVDGDLFSEEYQEEFIRTYCELFDTRDYVCGEHVWNFADFATAENIKRVQGNKKGVFTRDRKPKKVAWYLKERWS